VVFGYERKGFIRLKECFRVSKTEDHDQQFDSWRHSYFLLPLFFDLPFFLFFFLFHCFARAYSLYLGYHFFLVIWACPLAFEFLGLFCLLAFSRLYHLSRSLKFHLPPGVGCDPSRDFFHERKIIQAQKGISRDVLISERERNNKDGLSSFQAQTVKINKFWPHPIWWFGLCKDAFQGSWATSSLHTIIHTFKNTWFKSHGVRVFIHFFFFFFFFSFWFIIVTSIMELLDSIIILQVEC